ncbi:gluconokinase [Variovorax sp. HJSM1_2]|uniref:gluconokinase n=1 Tax=Variovorax sp. HJSM1_2 TaxID=3366263 RepID=UPI003BE6EEFC
MNPKTDVKPGQATPMSAANATEPRPILVVMGVSGCGKSTVGAALAQALDLPYLEGDDFHSAENVARMAAGTPLTDADRQGWLGILAQRLALAAQQNQGLVLSCSALKQRYRDMLRQGAPNLGLVYLHGDRAVLMQRMSSRGKHYMPSSLLDSQLQTLEPPGPEEGALAFSVERPVAEIVSVVLAAVAAATFPPHHKAST